MLMPHVFSTGGDEISQYTTAPVQSVVAYRARTKYCVVPTTTDVYMELGCVALR